MAEEARSGKYGGNWACPSFAEVSGNRRAQEGGSEMWVGLAPAEILEKSIPMGVEKK